MNGWMWWYTSEGRWLIFNEHITAIPTSGCFQGEILYCCAATTAVSRFGARDVDLDIVDIRAKNSNYFLNKNLVLQSLQWYSRDCMRPWGPCHRITTNPILVISALKKIGGGQGGLLGWGWGGGMQISTRSRHLVSNIFLFFDSFHDDWLIDRVCSFFFFFFFFLPHNM